MMYEEKEMEAIRKDVILQVECILNDIGPVFDSKCLMMPEPSETAIITSH